MNIIKKKPNTLESFIAFKKLNENKVMNILQEYGVISDECIAAKDVGDCGKAVSWLNFNIDKL
jgi:hypothetical protein